MQINVRLYGSLRDHLPAEQRGRAMFEVEEGTVAQALLNEIGLRRPVMIAINGDHKQSTDVVLQDNDKLAVFEFTAGG